jgi:phospholipid-translocating ATPase
LQNILDKNHWTGTGTPPASVAHIVEFLRCLGLCHGVVAEETKPGVFSYQSSSPDEVALSKFAAENAFVFRMATSSMKEITEMDSTKQYQLLNTLGE